MWNDFDPIGVYDGGNDWPEDEYDTYVLQSVGLLTSNADLNKFKSLVRSVVRVTMGLTNIAEEAIDEFAAKLRSPDV